MACNAVVIISGHSMENVLRCKNNSNSAIKIIMKDKLPKKNHVMRSFRNSHFPFTLIENDYNLAKA